MALISCRECAKDVSTEAVNCPSCGARLAPKSGVMKWVIGVPLAAFAAFMLLGMLKSNPEKSRDREVYGTCMDSLASADRARDGTSGFIASTCEKMRGDFVKKYGATP